VTAPIQQQAPWWVERLLIPAVFLLLGSVIAFGASQLTAWMDRRRAKAGFLKAIRLELLGLEEQLKASLAEMRQTQSATVFHSRGSTSCGEMRNPTCKPDRCSDQDETSSSEFLTS